MRLPGPPAVEETVGQLRRADTEKSAGKHVAGVVDAGVDPGVADEGGQPPAAAPRARVAPARRRWRRQRRTRYGPEGKELDRGMGTWRRSGTSRTPRCGRPRTERGLARRLASVAATPTETSPRAAACLPRDAAGEGHDRRRRRPRLRVIRGAGEPRASPHRAPACRCGRSPRRRRRRCAAHRRANPPWGDHMSHRRLGAIAALLGGAVAVATATYSFATSFPRGLLVLACVLGCDQRRLVGACCGVGEGGSSGFTRQRF